jgi:hypothetical protein
VCQCRIRSYCAHTKPVTKFFLFYGNIKCYSFITSENVSGKRINKINWQCLLYVLNNNFFLPNFLELFNYEVSCSLKTLFSGCQSYFWFLLYRGIYKNKRKGKELKTTSFCSNLRQKTPVFLSKWILLQFRHFVQYRNFTYKSSYVSSCFTNANKLSWIYLPFYYLHIIPCYM